MSWRGMFVFIWVTCGPRTGRSSVGRPRASGVSPTETDLPTLNRRGEQYVGRHFTLEEAIVNGQGKIRVDDSTWKIEGPEDLPAGSQVQVIAVAGTVLKVEAA